MRIERIELIGFKSFADKTVFNFHPGITSIVGPNGCGKSNIVDAFKWVLGEQSAKSLRGGSMGDVIFAGSVAKKTKGMAEVTLVLSDIVEESGNGSEGNGKKGPAKISVTRRLFRSGESEYLMNKVPCRLKDIRNMFLDTGLELKAYSILEQGRIGDIVNSKPLDRRFLIEEVAGVMKYKVRKHEASNKLESSKSNLQRIQDIVAEVKRQINTIDRHARKAERYKKLFEKIKNTETRKAKRDMKKLQGDILGFSEKEDAFTSKEAEISTHVHSAESLIEEKKRRCVDYEKVLADIRTNLYALEREATEDEGIIALLKSECQNLRERENNLIRQDSALDSEKNTTVETLEGVRNREIALKQELVTFEGVLEEKKFAFSISEDEIAEFENEVEDQRKSLFIKAEDISHKKNEINQIKLNIENIGKKTERSSNDITSIKDNLTLLHNEIEQAKNETIKIESEIKETNKVKDEKAGQLSSYKEQLAATEESLYREREELAAMNSKMESLKEIDKSQMASVDESIKTLCQVADIFESGPEYETAIEAILGDKLRAAVVKDHNEIMRALRHIKEQKKKRSGFIPVNPAIWSSSESAVYSGRPGVIGNASDFVSVREGFEKVAGALLSDVVLVDKLASALSLSQDLHSVHTTCFVTLDGEVVEPSGLVFGGIDKGVLKIKRQIKELENDISSSRNKISETERVVSDLKNTIVTIENEIISLDAHISSQEKFSHEMKVKVNNLEGENERLQKKQEFIALEISDDNKSREDLTITLQDKESGCSSLEEEKQLIDEKIRTIQKGISERRETLELMRSEFTGVKLELTAANEKLSSIRLETERLEAFLEDIEKRREDMLSERGEIQETMALKEQETLKKESELKTKILRVSELQSEAAKTNEVLESKNAELVLIEKQQKELSVELETIRRELGQIEMKLMEESMKLRYLIEDINKTYSIDIENADISDEITQEEEEKLGQLKDRINSMGPVSLGTIDEYEELKERYEFLTKQRDDLLESIKTLEETISKINRTSKRRLEEAFEALNEKFKVVFAILFGKGKAELQLTEGSILDAGIEIVAQPPGKRLQNMTLLSGGEKALTALSLLFAGFMIKPTPLCLLDEVDAPLDESNTERFINLLKELSEEIQFITITHNRRTMEAADYIYGITMEEPGSSKVVSMHLTEAEAV
jgi:chromosome segregation protein